jgi:hypothetical protein
VAFAERYDELVEESKRDADPARGIEPLAGGLRGFLQDIALVSDTDQMDDDGDKVTLMTLHSAKGLEFPVVFIAGLEEELLPHSRAIQDVSARAPIRRSRRNAASSTSGITRAEERLFLTRAEQRMFFGEFGFRTPSRFLSEIPPELLEATSPIATRTRCSACTKRRPTCPPSRSANASPRALRQRHDRAPAGLRRERARDGALPGARLEELLLQYAKLTRIGGGQG